MDKKLFYEKSSFEKSGLYFKIGVKESIILCLMFVAIAVLYLSAGVMVGEKYAQNNFCHVEMNGEGIVFDSNAFQKTTGLQSETITSYFGDVPCEFTFNQKLKYLVED